MNEYIGSILKVFIKPSGGAPMVEPATGQIGLLEGYGIEGDKNAHPFSPRQVLLTRQEDSDEFNIHPGELRENIVINGLDSSAFAPGALVQVGDSVQIRLTFHCEPCKRIGHLVHSFREIEGKRGILGVVLVGGLVQVSNKVTVTPDTYRPLPSVPYERFLLFLSQVPCGRVVTYKQVVIGMGVAESYIRAIPRYIQQTSPITYPVHRIVDSEGNVITNYIPDQIEKLSSESINIVEKVDLFGTNDRCYVNIQEYGWADSKLQLP